MAGYLYVLFWLVSFLSSAAGAICGIGGGIIIKPVLDAFNVLSVSSINFLSGFTVLGMSCYSMIKNKMSGEMLVDAEIGTPLAVGAAFGGVFGKWLFQSVSETFASKDMVGAVQASCLLVITVGTLVYTIKKDQIYTHKLRNPLVCMIIGLLLGILSSFLGIGGGPVNLVVLFYFFS
ncbi:MAG: TSUP family transporter, partial [Lacrimispora sp.]